MVNTLAAYLRRRYMRIRAQFPRLWKNYIYQSLLATAVVFIILLALSVQNAIVIASLGATACIVFTMPKSVSAKPRRIIGGHIIGLLFGSLFALIPHSSTVIAVTIYSFAVGITICLMAALDFEHPPAAGTALGVAITGFSPGVLVAVLTSSIVLALAHHFSKRFIKDLT